MLGKPRQPVYQVSQGRAAEEQTLTAMAAAQQATRASLVTAGVCREGCFSL